MSFDEIEPDQEGTEAPAAETEDAAQAEEAATDEVTGTPESAVEPIDEASEES